MLHRFGGRTWEYQGMSDARTRVYTDGACSGNPGPGGWGWVVPNGRWAAGPAANTTNQRMELAAVLDAVQTLEGPLQVVSDSTYVVNCFRDSWWKGWLKRGWKNSQKKPVANRDLWEPLIGLYQQRDVTFEWVKGHSGDEWNDVADRIAVAAAQQQRDLSGEGMPAEDLGGEDVQLAGGGWGDDAPAVGNATAKAPKKTAPASSDPTGRDAPAGHLLAITGHRPPDIGGYGDNPTATAIQNMLSEIIAAKAKMMPDLVVLTGLGLGSEQLAALAAQQADVPYIAVLAFPDPSAVWPKDTQRAFDAMLDAALDVIVLQNKVPDTKPKIAGALKRRDAWLARNSNEAILVWNQKKGPLSALAGSWEDQLGEGVWFLNPDDL